MRKRLLTWIMVATMAASAVTVSAEEIIVADITSEEVTVVDLATEEVTVVDSVTEEITVVDSATEEVTVVDSVTEAPQSDVITETEYVVASGYEELFTEADIAAIAQAQAQEITDEQTGAGTNFATYPETVAFTKASLKNRERLIQFTTIFSSENYWKNILADAEVENLLATPYDEGDYLTANIIGYKAQYTYSSSQGYRVYNIQMIYTDTAEYNQKVLTTLPGVMQSLNLNGKSDYEKIKIIHDKVCDSAFYSQRFKDYDNAGNYFFHSTYSSLIYGETVCQGYASLFHIMCKMAGIPSRYITGTGRTGAHAWNIVKLDGYWYNVDCTWDDGDTVKYTYFLKSPLDFDNHTRDAKFDTAEFNNKYPMATESYGSNDAGLGIDNIFNHTYTTIDGVRVTTKADGKPKLLIYYGDTCYNSQRLIKTIAESDWINKDKIDIIAIETYGGKRTRAAEMEAVEDFKSEYANDTDKIHFTYTNISQAIKEFNDYAYEADVEITQMPIIVLLDMNNKIQAVNSGAITADQLEKNFLEPMLPGWKPKQTSDVDVTGQFVDVQPGKWYVNAVKYAVDNGIMSGTSTNTFEPDTNCSRTMMVTILWSAEGKKTSASANPFIDVKSNDWFYNAVLWAVDNNITKGMSANTFGKTDVTREQMATFLMSYARNKGYDTSARADLSVFADEGRVSGWALDAMKWANANGIISGKTATTLEPKGIANRAQVAQMVMSFQNKFGK